MKKAPIVRQHELKLESQKLALQAKIIESKDKLRKVNEDLKIINPKAKEE